MDAFTGTYFQWRGNDTDLQCGVISGDEKEEETVFFKKLKVAYKKALTIISGNDSIAIFKK